MPLTIDSFLVLIFKNDYTWVPNIEFLILCNIKKTRPGGGGGKTASFKEEDLTQVEKTENTRTPNPPLHSGTIARLSDLGWALYLCLILHNIL
jgi:hypothetical protein